MMPNVRREKRQREMSIPLHYIGVNGRDITVPKSGDPLLLKPIASAVPHALRAGAVIQHLN